MRALLLAGALALAACASLDGNPTPRCADDGTCAHGLVCDRGFCVTDDAPADAGADAGAGCHDDHLTLCGTLCVDTETSALHCGNCTTICMLGTHCDHGECRH